MCKCNQGVLLQPMLPQEFDAVYALMQQAFPRDEIRPADGQRRLLARPEYRMLVCRQDSGEIVGLMAVWQFTEFVFLEHFAVNPACRGAGIGTRMLQELLSRAQKPVCLEVELPLDDLTRRRIAFYERNGFFLNDYDYIQPPMAEGQAPVPLRIMSHGSLLSASQFDRLRNTLYREVYPLSSQL